MGVSTSDDSEFKAVVTHTRALLRENSAWRSLWAGYAAEINCNKKLVESIRGRFREWAPLYVYMTTTSAKNANNSVSFKLRYMGQEVALLKGNKDGNHTLSTKNFETSNRCNFGCNISLPDDEDWRGSGAINFRSYFNSNPGRRNGCRKNVEHRLESRILTEFFKTESTDKALLRIQPVTPIENVRFPIPTPLSASNHKAVKYSKKSGGIDILARTGRGGKATRLCIMELKDENKNVEPPRETVKQAIAYATFIRELLRSDCGTAWWRLFGFRGELPEKLVLYTACVMPSSKCNDTSFSGFVLPIEADAIVLQYLYFEFDETNDKLKFISSSIPGVELGQTL